MNPEKGSNAISKMICMLEGVIPDDFSHMEFVGQYKKYIGMDYNGLNYRCACEDALSGKLTFNIGKIKLTEDQSIKLEANIRYPASMEYLSVLDPVQSSSDEAGFKLEIIDRLDSICFDENDDFIQLLMRAYQNVTGDLESGPLAIGGATYARCIPNAVAFGPLFPWQEDLAHEPNEFISIENLKLMTEIYGLALQRLLKKI